ncbi:UNVERIFIED_CONTAM: hypothetical protein PYX00_000210 [Menopon gallinae]|uniref:Glutamyl-tRNA(Gln) amidotransferase subunit A, mitochondrial n=1 Tax=Menopon gallinae TaxID=328185 RepID=A0AAW2I7P4_9NEOP
MYKTVSKLHKELLNKTTTTQDVIKATQKRIKETAELNIYTSVSSDLESQAKISQKYFNEGNPRSILEGIPVAVKDNFCIRNVRTTCGSKMLKDFVPKYTATVVTKLIQSGIVFVGKTNMDEFAMGSGTTDSIYGPTKNIWGLKTLKRDKRKSDNWFISGGSSGGSAVAVASGACALALGSDTGGSTRNPASYCGVVGLKPTYGVVSRYGLIPLVNSMDIPGVLANNVEDAYELLKLLAGPDVNDSTTVRHDVKLSDLSSEPSVKGLKVGMPIEYNCAGLTDEVRNTWKRVASLLQQGGAEIMPISMPHTKYSLVCYSVLNNCEVASNKAKYDGLQFGTRYASDSAGEMFSELRSSNFNQTVRERILAGNYFLLGKNYDKYFIKAMKVRRLILDDFLKAWRSGCNVLLTPTTLSDAPEFQDFIKLNEREQCESQDYCTQPANMSGCPAVTVPIELSRKELPLSVQLMAPYFEDKAMMEVALYIQKNVQFDQIRNHLIC